MADAAKARRTFPFLLVLLPFAVVAGVITYLGDPELFSLLLTIGSSALMVFSVAVMLLTYRKSRAVRGLSMFFGIITSIATLVISSHFMHMPFPGSVVGVSIFIGLVIGFGRSLVSSLYWENGAVRSKGDILYLLVWATIFAFNQVITAITGRPPRVAVMMMLISTGTVIGNNLLMMFRAGVIRLAAGRSQA